MANQMEQKLIFHVQKNSLKTVKKKDQGFLFCSFWFFSFGVCACRFLKRQVLIEFDNVYFLLCDRTPTDTHTQTQFYSLFFSFYFFWSQGLNLIIDVHKHHGLLWVQDPFAFSLEHKHWTQTHQNCSKLWPFFLIRAYGKATALCWRRTGTSMYCSVMEPPQAASPAQAVTPCLISLMGDPWQAAPALTSHGPQINVLTTGCGREGRQKHQSYLLDHNTWG